MVWKKLSRQKICAIINLLFINLIIWPKVKTQVKKIKISRSQRKIKRNSPLKSTSNQVDFCLKIDFLAILRQYTYI